MVACAVLSIVATPLCSTWGQRTTGYQFYHGAVFIENFHTSLVKVFLIFFTRNESCVVFSEPVLPSKSGTSQFRKWVSFIQLLRSLTRKASSILGKVVLTDLSPWCMVMFWNSGSVKSTRWCRVKSPTVGKSLLRLLPVTSSRAPCVSTSSWNSGILAGTAIKLDAQGLVILPL